MINKKDISQETGAMGNAGPSSTYVPEWARIGDVDPTVRKKRVLKPRRKVEELAHQEKLDSAASLKRTLGGDYSKATALNKALNNDIQDTGNPVESDGDEDEYDDSDDNESSSSHSDSQKQRQRLIIYQKYINHLFGCYISNSFLSAAKEAKGASRLSKSDLVLSLRPVVCLIPYTEEDYIRDPTGSHMRDGVTRKLYKASELTFELVNSQTLIHSCFNSTYLSFGGGGVEDVNGDDDGASSLNDNVLGENVYIVPSDIVTTQIISGLPIPFSVRISNVLFTKGEIDQKMRQTYQRSRSIAKHLRTHPPSQGCLRKSVPQPWIGDSFLHRGYSSSINNNNNNNNTEVVNDENFGNSAGYVSQALPCDSGDYYSDKRHVSRISDNQFVPVNAEYLSHSGGEPPFYPTATPTMINPSQQQQYMQQNQQRLRQTGADSSNKMTYVTDNRDIVVCVPPSVLSVPRVGVNNAHYGGNNNLRGNEHFQGKSCMGNQRTFGTLSEDGRLCFKSLVNDKLVRDNCTIPRECLISRLTLPPQRPESPFVNELHNIDNPELKPYQNKEVHIKSLRDVTGFMRKYEFYFRGDFMYEKYANYGRKLQETLERRSNTQPHVQAPAPAYNVGHYKDDTLTLKLHNETALFNFGSSSSDAVNETTTTIVEPNSGGGGKGVDVYAIPKSFCNNMRARLDDSVYKKLRYSDFSSPRIEVNVPEDERRMHLMEIEDNINVSLLRQQQYTSSNTTALTPLKMLQEPLDTIHLCLNVTYHEVHQPCTFGEEEEEEEDGEGEGDEVSEEEEAEAGREHYSDESIATDLTQGSSNLLESIGSDVSDHQCKCTHCGKELDSPIVVPVIEDTSKSNDDIAAIVEVAPTLADIESVGEAIVIQQQIQEEKSEYTNIKDEEQVNEYETMDDSL